MISHIFPMFIVFERLGVLIWPIFRREGSRTSFFVSHYRIIVALEILATIGLLLSDTGHFMEGALICLDIIVFSIGRSRILAYAKTSDPASLFEASRGLLRLSLFRCATITTLWVFIVRTN